MAQELVFVDIRTPETKALHQISHSLFALLEISRKYSTRIGDMTDDEYCDMLKKSYAISEQIKEMGLVRKPFVPSKYTDSPY